MEPNDKIAADPYNEALAPEEAIELVRELDNPAENYLAPVVALLQALADVRTLDDWADAARGMREHRTQPTLSAQGPGCVCLYWDGRPSRYFYGPTPEAARHAAAEWVRGQR